MPRVKSVIANLLSKLDRHSSGKNVLLLFFITQAVYALMIFVTIPEVVSYSKGLKILDLLPAGYSFEYVNKLFDALGSEGRNTYLFRQIPVDMVYPAFFAVSNSLLFTYLLKKISSKQTKRKYMAITPIIAGFFDYIENIGIIAMINIYPATIFWLAKITNLFSIFKSIATTIFLIELFYLLIILIAKKLKNCQL